MKKKYDHFLNLTCDAGDPPVKAPSGGGGGADGGGGACGGGGGAVARGGRQPVSLRPARVTDPLTSTTTTHLHLPPP